MAWSSKICYSLLLQCLLMLCRASSVSGVLESLMGLWLQDGAETESTNDMEKWAMQEEVDMLAVQRPLNSALEQPLPWL